MKIEAKVANTTPQGDSSGTSGKILRFRKSERLLHWALALPFMVCLASALILVLHYNPDPTRPYRAVFAASHRIAGIAFIVLPILTTIISKGDFRIHFYNIRQAWLWTLHDIKWLLLMGLAAISKKINLPEQGKFNAAEKLNFMYLMSTYCLYVLSGFAIWLTNAAFVAWIVHCAIAFLAIPLILGHVYMATINASSRIGLSGMISGYVDRHWARHHYTKWYQEHFEDDSPVDAVAPITAGEQFRMNAHAESMSQMDTNEIELEIVDIFDNEDPADTTRTPGISAVVENSRDKIRRAKPSLTTGRVFASATGGR